jgi:hypothetical protein
MCRAVIWRRVVRSMALGGYVFLDLPAAPAIAGQLERCKPHETGQAALLLVRGFLDALQLLGGDQRNNPFGFVVHGGYIEFAMLL